ncbi:MULTISPECIES: hypothetical protein [Streptomyces]|uniref:Uncharacterized protein n=1 Tax=Streptomyces microflavus TaxID=1919 RepID=A0ABV1Q2I6_STRMI|nr:MULTISPECIES: hypothetical protein [Streptomyces]QQZ57669.1 hypothetical protein IFE09_31965 [Streptomyces microflavus]QTA36126.1 hypothetical protein JHY03_63410 [Streptomyces sp. CA-256286]WTF73153.1 hypothetical protein OH770_32870 [Streptomyces microflavus]
MPGTGTAAVLDLFVEEPVLGKDSRFLREAGIAFGHPTVARVGDDELPEPVKRRPDLRERHFCALRLPFDLEELRSGQRYLRAAVRVTFDGDVRGVTVSCSTSDEAIEVRTFGVGRSELSYVLSPRREGSGFAPSAQLAAVVLETPLCPAPVTGTIDASVTFTHRQFGVSTRKEAEPERPLRFILDLASGSYVVDGAG